MQQAARQQFPSGDPGQIDPYGIARSISVVQRAWLTHPETLAAKWCELYGGMAAVQYHAWARWLGTDTDDIVPASEYDERFSADTWTQNPVLHALKEHYLHFTRWLEDAIYTAPDCEDKTRRRAALWVREWLNAIAPSNYFWTNPVAVERAFRTSGQSVMNGLCRFLEEAPDGLPHMTDTEAFEVGRDIATTPGAVVMRNELVELIQYEARTDQVYSVPIVIVAPWINKYYILDLNERKSLVSYLTEQGFTVFVTSWRNPGPEQAMTQFEDYLRDGVAECVEAAREITGAPQVHLTGYCIGGTIVSAYMAWMNRQRRAKNALPVAHWTLFTTLVDFSDPGEIDLFLDEEAIVALEARMARQGYLDGADMATAFRLLRANSLIWHYWVNNYLLGEPPPPFDVLYWNMDTTRMPAAMHSFYLRELYLNNRLVVPDALTLAGRPIDLGRIVQPLYAVGTEQDHIAPWKSTFRVAGLIKGTVHYTLATSGHILGIVNPPVEPPKRRYWSGEATGQTDADRWLESQEKRPGSWWEDWSGWLSNRCGDKVSSPALGSTQHPVLHTAPGCYVLER